MLLHACGGFSKALPGHSRGLHRPPGVTGVSRGLQGPPGACRGLHRKNHKHVLNGKCARRVPPKPRTLGEAEISRGMVRLDWATHHGGGGGAEVRPSKGE